MYLPWVSWTLKNIVVQAMGKLAVGCFRPGNCSSSSPRALDDDVPCSLRTTIEELPTMIVTPADPIDCGASIGDLQQTVQIALHIT